MENYIKTISLFGDVAVRISHNRLKFPGTLNMQDITS